MIAVVDAGPLISAVDATEEDHAACLAALRRRDLELVIPALVLAEACYMIANRHGPKVEARFLRGLVRFAVEAPTPEHWPRMADLVEQYANFPLGAANASVIAVAERLNTDTLITLDHRHFGAVRPRHCPSFRLLPD